MRNSYKMALSGVLAALAVGFMVLGGIIPMAGYCSPVIASVLLVPVLESCGRKLAWSWYGAVSILSLLLCPDLESALVFVCMGYYPIVRIPLSKITRFPIRISLKLLGFNLSLLIMGGILFLVMGGEALVQEMLADGIWLLAVAVVLANITFLMVDFLLGKLTPVVRRSRKLHK